MSRQRAKSRDSQRIKQGVDVFVEEKRMASTLKGAGYCGIYFN